MQRFIFKLGILVIVVFSLQALVAQYLLLKNCPTLKPYALMIPPYAGLVSQLDKQTDVLVFGDSTMTIVDKNDTDTRRTDTKLKALLPGHRVASVVSMAYGMEMYLDYCRFLLRSGMRPGTIIIPVNFRSFSTSWVMKPQHQFEIQRGILQGGIMRWLLLAFYKPLKHIRYNFFSISREEYLSQPVYNGKKKAGTVANYRQRGFARVTPENTAAILLFYYLYSLDPNHKYLRALRSIIRETAAAGVKVIVYITPIDYQLGEKYHPGVFIKRLEENLAVLQKLINQLGVRCINMTFDLGSEAFTWTQYPNEHLNQKGRLHVAQRLSRAILEKKGH